MYYQFRLNGYTIQDLLVLNRVTSKLYRRVRTLVRRTVYLLAGFVVLLTGILLLAGGDSIALGIVLALFGLLYLCLGILYHRLSAWRSHRMLLKNTGEITATLDDAGLREQGEKGEGFHPYRAFISCVHSQGRYFLFIDKKHAIILPETAITVGDPMTLGPKLAEKFGGTLREL